METFYAVLVIFIVIVIVLKLIKIVLKLIKKILLKLIKKIWGGETYIDDSGIDDSSTEEYFNTLSDIEEYLNILGALPVVDVKDKNDIEEMKAISDAIANATVECEYLCTPAPFSFLRVAITG